MLSHPELVKGKLPPPQEDFGNFVSSKQQDDCTVFTGMFFYTFLSFYINIFCPGTPVLKVRSFNSVFQPTFLNKTFFNFADNLKENGQNLFAGDVRHLILGLLV